MNQMWIGQALAGAVLAAMCVIGFAVGATHTVTAADSQWGSVPTAAISTL